MAVKRQTGFRFTPESLEWLKAQAEKRGISMNDVVQEWMNAEMAKGTGQVAQGVA